MSESKAFQEVLNSLMHPELKTIDLSLDRMEALLEAMDNPQLKLPPVIHVAGTNGKGSTIAFIRSILEEAGYRVHCYTSPHLEHFKERICVAGEYYGEAWLLGRLQEMHAITQKYPATFFESTTALAMQLFSEAEADFTLLEVGLGGRFDATNVIDKPLVSVITPVGMDHMEFLGDSLDSIAREKGGIIKSSIPLVLAPQELAAHNALMEVIQEKGVPLSYVEMPIDEDIELGLQGAHQRVNAAVACAVIEQVRKAGYIVSEDAMANGLANATWPARLQWLTHGALNEVIPGGWSLWVDGGHNQAAGEAIAKWAAQQAQPVHLICGMVARKSAEDFIKPMAPYIDAVTAIPIENEPESMDKHLIYKAAMDLGIQAATAESLDEALKHSYALKGQDSGTILIAGSLYLAGKVLERNGPLC